jgi:hypothetical protein
MIPAGKTTRAQHCQQLAGKSIWYYKVLLSEITRDYLLSFPGGL